MSMLHAKLTLLPRKTHAKSMLIPRKIHGKKSRDMRNSTFVSVRDINITLTVLYFSNLYSDTQRDHYDTEFQSGIEESVQRIISNFPISCWNRDTANISTYEVINAVKCLKSKKACGPDKVYNEHLILEVFLSMNNFLLCSVICMHMDMCPRA